MYSIQVGPRHHQQGHRQPPASRHCLPVQLKLRKQEVLLLQKQILVFIPETVFCRHVNVRRANSCFSAVNHSSQSPPPAPHSLLFSLSCLMSSSLAQDFPGDSAAEDKNTIDESECVCVLLLSRCVDLQAAASTPISSVQVAPASCTNELKMLCFCSFYHFKQ